jgi:hypothetical protein
MRRASLAAVVFAVLAAACAGNPEPGDDGYAYNVNGEYTAEFITDDDGTAIYGTITLATAKGGIVTGKMALTNPFTVDGDVEGLLFEDELTLTRRVSRHRCGLRRGRFGCRAHGHRRRVRGTYRRHLLADAGRLTGWTGPSAAPTALCHSVSGAP